MAPEVASNIFLLVSLLVFLLLLIYHYYYLLFCRLKSYMIHIHIREVLIVQLYPEIKMFSLQFNLVFQLES